MTIQEKFATAISEAVSICLEGGMHTSEMIAPMEKELKWRKDASRDPPMPAQ